MTEQSASSESPEEDAPRDPWLRNVLVGIAGVFVLGSAASTLIWPPVNQVSTKAPHASYPELQAFETSADVARVREVLRGLGGRFAHVGDSERHALFEASTPTLGFVDDVRVEWTAIEGGLRIHARSASRFGKLDFGQNARNLRALLSHLRAHLPARGAGSGS